MEGWHWLAPISVASCWHCFEFLLRWCQIQITNPWRRWGVTRRTVPVVSTYNRHQSAVLLKLQLPWASVAKLILPQTVIQSRCAASTTDTPEHIILTGWAPLWVCSCLQYAQELGYRSSRLCLNIPYYSAPWEIDYSRMLLLNQHLDPSSPPNLMQDKNVCGPL